MISRTFIPNKYLKNRTERHEVREARIFSTDYAARLRPQPNNNFEVTPPIQNQERSDCTLGSGRLIPIVFFSLACSRFAPGSVIVLATKTRSCSFATQITPILLEPWLRPSLRTKNLRNLRM